MNVLMRLSACLTPRVLQAQANNDYKGKKLVVAESCEDTIKLKEEIVMLKKELQEQAKHKTIVIESLDQDKKLAYENKLQKEENQYLKLGLMYDKQE